MATYDVETLVSGPSHGTRTGIPGFTVRLMARCPDGDITVAEGLTRADGVAALGFDAPREAVRNDDSVLVRELVIDRDGLLVHQAQRARAVDPGERLSIACRLDEASVTRHMARPLSFDAHEPGVDRIALETDVERAIGGLASPGTVEFTNLRTAALCPGPAFDLFDELRRDALDVIDGDPRAIDRFQDTLQVIRDRNLTTSPAVPLDIETFVPATQSTPGLQEAPFTLELRRMSPSLGRSIAGVAARGRSEHQPERPRPATVVPREHGAIAMAAAARIAANPSTAIRDVGAIFDTLCEFEQLGVLRNIGLDGLNNPRSLKQFGGMLGALGGEWGPDDGPPIGERPRIPCEPFAAEHAECARDIVESFRRMVPTYTISAIDRPDACPGDTIVITGTGFTETAGKVEFRLRNGSVESVDPVVWTDSRIEVVVPPDVTCGIRLRVFERTDRVCDRFVDVFRRPNILVDFVGGAAHIVRFGANSGGSPVCAEPGEPLTVRWETCAAETVLVQLLDEDGDIVSESNDTSGQLSLTVPTGGDVRTWTATATVTGRCAPARSTESIDIRVEPRPDLTIHGIEVTQAIQHYRSTEHLNNSTGPDNSLALVVGKAAWVRVYLRSGVDPGENDGRLDGVTGTLRLSRIVDGRRRFVRELDPTNAPVAAQDDFGTYRAERGAINTSLNFLIPAGDMTGRLVLSVNVDAPDSCHGPWARDDELIEVDVAQRNRLLLRGIPYAFQPAAGTGLAAAAAPTLAQFRADAALAFAQWPVSAMRNRDVTFTATQTTRLPLTDAATALGACSPNWNALLAAVNVAATNDGPRANTVYYGYLPNAIPVGPVVGCGSGGLTAGRQGDAVTMSHEIGHGLGRPHSPCNVNGDNNYTVYQPYDTVISGGTAAIPNIRLQRASIGEFGLDIRNGNLFDPTATSDLMSYCGPSWMSKYVHGQVFNSAILNPTAVPVGAEQPVKVARGATSRFGGAVEPSPLIVMWGTVDRGDVEVDTVIRKTTTPHDGAATDLVAELIDDDGEVAATTTVTALVNEAGCGCGGGDGEQPNLRGDDASFAFRADLRDVTPGQRLRIRRGDDVVWERERPPRRPRVADVGARIRRDGMLEVTWNPTVAKDCVPSAWITCTDADGGDHQGLVADVGGTKQAVDVSQLPGGPVVIDVMISDGFSCVSARSAPIEVPARPDEAIILHPDPDSILPADGVLTLQGLTSDGHDEPIETCAWKLDGIEVAAGPDATIAMPAPGEHSVEFVAGRGRQQVTFRVGSHLADALPDDD